MCLYRAKYKSTRFSHRVWESSSAVVPLTRSKQDRCSCTGQPYPPDTARCRSHPDWQKEITIRIPSTFWIPIRTPSRSGLSRKNIVAGGCYRSCKRTGLVLSAGKASQPYSILRCAEKISQILVLPARDTSTRSLESIFYTVTRLFCRNLLEKFKL